MITNDARCTREIKPRTVMEKVAFNKKILFTGKLDLNSRKKLEECYGWSISLHSAESRTLESISEIA
jgi:hypothetical protein